MKYFEQGFIDFFTELYNNNHREWFHAHKKEYEEYVKKPFNRFVADVIAAVKEEDPLVNIQVKDAVFRINRDIRFSKDKTPYKTFVSAAVSRGGRKDMEFPGIYMHFELGNIMFAGGCYMPAKENLQKIRKYIIDNPQKVDKTLKNKAFREMYGGLADGEKNKILPKEFKEYGQSHPLIYYKQYYFQKTYEDNELLLSDELLQFVIKHYKVGLPVSNMLIEAMGR